MGNCGFRPQNSSNLRCLVKKIAIGIFILSIHCVEYAWSFPTKDLRSLILGSNFPTDSFSSGISPLTLLGKARLRLFDNGEGIGVFESHAIDVVADLMKVGALMEVNTLMADFQDGAVVVLAETHNLPSRHGSPKTEEALLAQAVVGVAIPMFHGAKAIFRTVNDRNDIKNIQKDLDHLVAIWSRSYKILNLLDKVSNPSSETRRLKTNLQKSLGLLIPAVEATRFPADSILDRVARLANGDVKTGFVNGLSSELDLLRRVMGVWESNVEGLGLVISTLADIDASIAVAPANLKVTGIQR